MSIERTKRVDDTATDTELITACLMNNEQAWEVLIRRYARLIYSVPLRFNLTESDAADVFQNVCLTLYRKLDTLRDQNRLGSWLLTTAHRQSLDLLERRRVPEAELQDEAIEAEADNATNDSHNIEIDADLKRLEDGYMLRQGMNQLSERCRHVVWHLFFNPAEPSYAEIASQVGISSPAVSVYRARCLDHLRRILEEMDF